MHLNNKPEGYVSAFASHGEPAYQPPPIKLIESKQEETLLGANLKSFIKERLFGNFINYTKLFNARKYNFTPPISALNELRDGQIEEDTRKSAPTIRQNYKHRINDLRATVQRKIQDRYQSKGEKSGQKALKSRLSHRNSLGSNIQESIVLNTQRNKINRTSFAKKSLNGSHASQNHSYDLEKYPAPSFISAIEDNYEQPNKAYPSGRKERLSPINNKAEIINKLQIVKSNLASNQQIKKILNRFQVQKFDILENVWEMFCQPIKSKTEKLQNISNNSNINKDFQNANYNQSFISGIRSIDNRISEFNKNSLSIQKSKISIVRTYFMKQSFSQYLNSTNTSYPPLASLYASFFEINSKTYDELKVEEYKNLVEPIVSSSPRVWAVSSFRFWDTNQDGIICSKDIFAMYQALDMEQARLKQMITGQTHKGLKTILKLKEILEQLRKLILEINFDLQIQKKGNSQRQDEDLYEIKYLEEALLRKKQLKYSDLLLVLGQNIKISTKDVKKSVIQTAKQLNMNFLATDHNEQTREDRQHIENLKQQLRKEKIEISQRDKTQILQTDKVQGLNYKTYYEKELYSKIKGLVLELFAIQLQH